MSNEEVAIVAANTAGPPAGSRVLELSAIGPFPFAAMLLAGPGAQVVHMDRCKTVGRPSAGALDEVLTSRDDLGRSRGRPLGADTKAVLGEAGCDRDRIAARIAAGVVRQAVAA